MPNDEYSLTFYFDYIPEFIFWWCSYVDVKNFFLLILTVYKKTEDVMRNHPDADVLVSFASLRSAYESTVEALQYPQVKHGLSTFVMYCNSIF